MMQQAAPLSPSLHSENIESLLKKVPFQQALNG
jgi:hypothetical protein